LAPNLFFLDHHNLVAGEFLANQSFATARLGAKALEGRVAGEFFKAFIMHPVPTVSPFGVHRVIFTFCEFTQESFVTQITFCSRQELNKVVVEEVNCMVDLR
jgi:hypothetical protein